MSATRRRRIPIPLLLMVAVLAAGGLSALQRRGSLRLPWKAGPSMPADVALAAFEAAKTGDADRYLGYFTGKMLTDLQRARQEMGDAKFRRYLRDSTAPVKGVAVYDEKDAGDGRRKLRVEYVYADKNDIQEFTFAPGGPWRISDVSSTQRIKTLIPYGTEAVPLER